MNVARYAKRDFDSDSDENYSPRRQKVQSDNSSTTEIVPLVAQLSADDPWITLVHEQVEAKAVLDHFYGSVLKAHTICIQLLQAYPALSISPRFLAETTHINRCSSFYIQLKLAFDEMHFNAIFNQRDLLIKSEQNLESLELRAGLIVSLLGIPTSQTDPTGAAALG